MRRVFIITMPLFALATLATTMAAGQDAKKKDANPEYFHPLRGNLLTQPGFDLFGPRADEQVFFEPTGMRFNLTPGNKGGRPNMGIAIPMSVKGDFEITVNFELLQEPETADAGENGTRFSLGIFKDTPKPCVATISRSVGVKQGPLFVSWWQLWPNPEEPQQKPKSYLSPTKVKAGRLRFARVGKALTFLVSDGEKPFVKIRENPDFGDENLKLIRLSAATGGETAALEVRLTDLHVRASEAPKLLTPGGQVVSKKPFERVEILFQQGLEQPNLSLVGANTEAIAKTDATGLRLNVPAERGDHNVVGVEAKYRLKGDFDITLAYELLALPDPAPPLGAGVQLWIRLENNKGATVTRMQKPKGGTFGANYIAPGPDGKDVFTGFINTPANAMKGQLRLTRTGVKLVYQVGDGEAAFKSVKEFDFDKADVVSVRAVCNTGWEGVPIDARLRVLDLKAEQIPNDPQRAPEIAGLAVTPTSNWLITTVLASLCVAGLGAIGAAGAVVVLRKRGKSVKEAKPESAAPAAQVQVACSQCHKKLRVRVEDAGKKIKCPHCGAVTTKKRTPKR